MEWSRAELLLCMVLSGGMPVYLRYWEGETPHHFLKNPEKW